MLVVLVAGCGGGTPPSRPVQPPAPPPEPPPAATLFVNATAESGIQYRHGYLNPPEFVDPEEFGGGVAVGDYDGDGLVDLFIARGDIGPNLLYRNLGDNVFEDVAMEAGVAFTKSASENYRHSGPAFADMDGDGDLDLFVGGLEFDPSFVFTNEGDGTFTDVTAGSGIDTLGARHTVSAGFGDYDLDGDLDMFLTHWGTEDGPGVRLHTEHLWRNDTRDGEIRFFDASLEAGIASEIFSAEPVASSYGEGFDCTFTPTFARMNEDRYPDLLISADFLTSMFFVNNGDGTFTNATDRSVIQDRNGMGSAVGDYDGDGDLDWFVTSVWSVPNEAGDQIFELGNRLYRNAGGELSDVTELAGVQDGGWGWGACFADFDNDGDTDIFQAHRNESNAGTLWQNDTGGRYLKVKLNGLPPNTEAAGARIRVTTGERTQLREIMIGSNFTSQNPAVQMFGLDGAAEADLVEVEWPDGESTTMRNVAGDQTLRLDHPRM